MELTHRFTVPGSVEQTWDRFGDIADLARCFPGAQVTSVEGDAFEGTVKVKLGPIALVYAGSGSFTAKDPQAHTFEVVAKGRDKRGNGTAGATVTVRMEPAAGGPDAGTQVQVDTDLAITGKPAQFGRGVMQDVSDKLLAQFVACLQERSESSLLPPELSVSPAESAVSPAESAVSPAESAVSPAESAVSPAESAPGAAARPTTAPPAGDGGPDALDLGATVLPVLLRGYGRQLAIGVLALVAAVWVVRRLRRG